MAYCFCRYGLHNPFLYYGVHKQIETPVTDLISKFLWLTAGNLKDPDDLFICIMSWLSRTWAIIKERRNSIFQMGTVLFSNLLQKGKSFKETPPPLADRILSRTYPSRYLHIVHTISRQQDYFGTLYLTGG